MAPVTKSFKTDSDVVFVELPNRGSRDEITIASGSGALVVGQVLGKVTTGGKYKPVAPAAVTGEQVAAAILLDKADATSADVIAVGLVRIAQIVGQTLVWTAGMSAGEKTAALAQLELQHITVRIGV